MALEQSDLEQIERIIYKNGDDLAISIARSFERLEERSITAEARVLSCMDALEKRIETSEHTMLQDFDSLRNTLS